MSTNKATIPPSWQCPTNKSYTTVWTHTNSFQGSSSFKKQPIPSHYSRWVLKISIRFSSEERCYIYYNYMPWNLLEVTEVWFSVSHMYRFVGAHFGMDRWLSIQSFMFVFEGSVHFNIGLFLEEEECDGTAYDIHSHPYTNYSVFLYLGWHISIRPFEPNSSWWRFSVFEIFVKKFWNK